MVKLPDNTTLDRLSVAHMDVRVSKNLYVSPIVKVYGTVADFTQSGGTQGTEGKSGKAAFTSDRQVKENIVRIGEHPLGIGLYLFDYKPPFRQACGYGRQFGVMADEVELVMPQAVSIHATGYKVVDHTMLGIERA
jgi:hypothetical protein